MPARVISKTAAKKAVRAARLKAAEAAAKPRGTKAERMAVAQAKLTPERDWVCSWEFELAARAEGARLVAGVDEVGRGPLFGPVVAAAVILPAGLSLPTISRGLTIRRN